MSRLHNTLYVCNVEARTLLEGSWASLTFAIRFFGTPCCQGKTGAAGLTGRRRYCRRVNICGLQSETMAPCHTYY
ncbi:hypothetical protein CVT26_002467 [Gymnopilus dilepis]|uniref:Uncharacterized protein n=1 Tax=Gymnopilus dilepis TaxID=231916 RepID=A0A409YX35_9AGAR|nr:hypothetical protein CVT26_002467 [Gymnopilus dilepis]